MKYEFKHKNNDGVDVILVVTAKNGKVKTMSESKVYTLDGLIKLAATGALSTEDLKINTRLSSVSQETAKEWIEAAAIGGSEHLTVVEMPDESKAEAEVAAKAAEAKAKAEAEVAAKAAKAEAEAGEPKVETPKK